MSIRAKLMSSFAGLVCLLIGLGVFGVYSLSTVNDKTVEITENWMEGTRILNDITDRTNEVRRLELNHLIEKDLKKMDEVEKNLGKSAGEVDKKIDEYKKLVNSLVYDTQAAKDKDLAAILCDFS